MSILREGMSGMQVAELKEKLNALGYDCGTGDIFDSRTGWAVCWFRHENGLEDSHEADEAFFARLNAGDAAGGVSRAVQFYNMKDPIWKDYPYDAVNTPEIETIATSGCGPTCMAMAVSTALRRAVLPPTLADWANANGFRDPDGINGTDESFFPACAARYGLESEIITEMSEASFARIADELRAGNAVITNVTPDSPYTNCGHYNIVSKLENGRISISDPNPRNWDLPAYTVDEWLKGSWCKLYMIVRPKSIERLMDEVIDENIEALEELAK